ncbi:MAG: hypothetical protein ACRC0J_00600 [Shewanella oncorhynchi]
MAYSLSGSNSPVVVPENKNTKLPLIKIGNYRPKPAISRYSNQGGGVPKPLNENQKTI